MREVSVTGANEQSVSGQLSVLSYPVSYVPSSELFKVLNEREELRSVQKDYVKALFSVALSAYKNSVDPYNAENLFTIIIYMYIDEASYEMF